MKTGDTIWGKPIVICGLDDMPTDATVRALSEDDVREWGMKTFYEDYGDSALQLDQVSADSWFAAKVAEKVAEHSCTVAAATNIVRLNLQTVASHEQTDVRHRMERLYGL